jgi:predicted enzyme related to lactoylglutathione lyase
VNELDSRDSKAKAFYSAVFGWKPVDVEGPMAYTEWQLGDATIGGVLAMPTQVPFAVMMLADPMG